MWEVWTVFPTEYNSDGFRGVNTQSTFVKPFDGQVELPLELDTGKFGVVISSIKYDVILK